MFISLKNFTTSFSYFSLILYHLFLFCFVFAFGWDPPSFYDCFNHGNGQLSDPVQYPLGEYYSFYVESADLDQNGYNDLFITGYSVFDDQGVSILYNDGTGTFDDEPQVDNNEDSIISNTKYTLSNYPNPFNPETTISYELPDNVKNPTIEIFNIKGNSLMQYQS